MRRFRDRTHAGQLLAEALAPYADRKDLVVLGLPRGGIPVAFEVAKALDAPLDVFVVRKLGVPGHEELAMGAIGPEGRRVINHDVVDSMGIPDSAIDAVARKEEQELHRREEAYRDGRPAAEVQGKVAILIDDGLATGASMRAAIRALRAMEPSRIVVAVPTGSPDACASLEQEADEVICLLQPEAFMAVGAWYQDFTQTTDEEVRSLLARAPAPVTEGN